MKFVLASLLLSSVVFADGIPVRMEQQTPYNWLCSYSQNARATGKLHLMVSQGATPTLFVNVNSAVGVGLPAAVAKALLSQNYAAIDGKTYTDKRYNRSLTFNVQGKSLLVKLQDGTYKLIASGCRAQFRAIP